MEKFTIYKNVIIRFQNVVLKLNYLIMLLFTHDKVEGFLLYLHVHDRVIWDNQGEGSQHHSGRNFFSNYLKKFRSSECAEFWQYFT